MENPGEGTAEPAKVEKTLVERMYPDAEPTLEQQVREAKDNLARCGAAHAELVEDLTEAREEIAKLQEQLKREQVLAEVRGRERDVVNEEAIAMTAQRDEALRKALDLRRGKGELAGDRERWRIRAQKAEASTPAAYQEAIAENDRLRHEISVAHQRHADLERQLALLRDESRELRRRAEESGMRFQALEGTAKAMQLARDQAEKARDLAKLNEARAEEKAVEVNQDLAHACELLRQVQVLQAPLQAALPILARLERKEFKELVAACGKAGMVVEPEKATTW